MSTDQLLNKLRCAECHQIKFDQFCAAAIKAWMVLSVGYLIVKSLMRAVDMGQ
jgi:hypothetical protein